jgi:hypothetical protein
MLTFRKQHPQPQPERLDIQYNPPPDGAYPPRLLALQSSIWLPEAETITLIADRATIRREGSSCVLSPTSNRAVEILVNGQPLFLARPLKDGDFIQWRKERFIFQADPVADRKKRIASWGDELPTPQPSKWLHERVVINQSGLSLNSGKDFARWDEVSMLDLSYYGGRQCTAKIRSMKEGQTIELKTSLKRANIEEIHQLMLWLYRVTPFDLSMFESFSEYSDWFPNAYFAAASEKLYVPSQNNQLVLPADVNFIFDIPTRRERIIGWFPYIGIMLILSALLALLRYPDRFIVGWINIIIVFVGFAMLWTAVFWAFVMLRKGLNRLHRHT